jgi:N-acetylmuramoyl-L-alanine amidase
MPITHTVEQGDTLVRLGELYGIAPDTIWNDDANAELRTRRSDMNVLCPGDIVIIPDKVPRLEKRPTGATHVFQTVTTPALFRLQIFKMHKPRAEQDFTLTVDTSDEIQSGKTDKNGILEKFVDPKARLGKIVIGPDNQAITVNFGHLNPLREISGVQQRLRNLGYDPGDASETLNPAIKAALRTFQRDHKIKADGELNETTRAKLGKVHDEPFTYPAPA